jgi:hypothetical protein
LTVCEWFDIKTTLAVFIGLASKPVMTVSDGLASKRADSFLQFSLKTDGDDFSWFDLKIDGRFLIKPQNQGDGWFTDLCLKTDNSGLVIWKSKSPRQFLGLCLKTKQDLVCRLCHKTDGWRSVRDMRRDLAACFMWMYV